ncbi:FYN-binding protein 1 isoform X1 [Hemicordylus capensis]|uniref:FYN-binding protein 1 isoform X1 n=1 Tax=Hemicordylus capensis TaxID=884348 RepID=UPI0023043B74|nr:FYN-binding protein 1 isoform X1 [Hemicordylus capensis]
MAKFSNNNPVEEVHNRQARVVGQPSLGTKSAFEKFVHLENASPSARPSSNLHKSPSLKPPLGIKPSLQDTSDKDPKPLKASPVASKVAALAQAVNREANEKPGFPRPMGPKPTELRKEESKPVFPKPPENRLPGHVPPKNELKPLGPKPSLKPEPQEQEAKPGLSKVADVKGKFSISSQEHDPKPPFPKLGLKPKPSHNEEITPKNVFLNAAAPTGSIGPKPKVNSFRSTKDAEGKGNNGMDSPTSHFPGVALKHVSSASNMPQILSKGVGQQNEENRPSVTKNVFRMNQEDSGSGSGTVPGKFVSVSKVATTGPWASTPEQEEKDKVPKRKALPPPFKLGAPPQKPSRPPTVDLERFQKCSGNNPTKQVLPPPVPPCISVTQAPAPQLPPPLPPTDFHPSVQAPVLPPRNIKPRDNDDVDSEGPGNAEGQNSSGEQEEYEDLDEMRTTREEEQKREKEAKKKIEKEQKEKEKKEQEMRKKFKLAGPIEVIHQARARTDCKGGKNELSFKQGDNIEIIRVTDNPEGKWLGRTRGSYGYIKTTMVEIDYDSLKRKPRPPIQPRHPDSDQELYDDVGEQDSISSGSATGVGFPPPPDDIYDGVEEDDDIQTRTASAKQTGKDSGDSDVYDDVEPSEFPPPPTEMSLALNAKSLSFGRGKSDDRDSQKLKKMEKEEKEFRKKFKYDGDIKVLYSTTINRAPSPKKRGSKDLQVKPGESVQVIKDVDDTKVLCRNGEGKYGYVRKSCIFDEDEEIYDDIADDCIYDND